MLHLECLEERECLAQTIAIIDSGIDYTQPALQDIYIDGYDFADQDDDPFDGGPSGGTGTHISNVVKNIGDQYGVDVEIISLRIFNNDGYGDFDWAEQALMWVFANRDIYNIDTVLLPITSIWNSDNLPSWSVLEDELSILENSGILTIAAAGNNFHGEAGLNYPAASPHVIAAMSVDNDGSLSYFSQRSELAIAAAGRGEFSGTLTASANLAGASLVVRDLIERLGGNTSPQNIHDRIVQSADTVFDDETATNYSILNLDNTIDSLLSDPEFINSHLFYEDLSRIDSSKTPFKLGETSTFDSITGYEKGINGIVFDIPKGIELTEFKFHTGITNDYLNWEEIDAESIEILDAVPNDVFTRVIIKLDNVTDTYVSTSFNDEAFFYGSNVGDTGATLTEGVRGRDSADLFSVSISLFTEAEVDNQNDLNKDGIVDSFDFFVIVKAGIDANSLPNITPQG